MIKIKVECHYNNNHCNRFCHRVFSRSYSVEHFYTHTCKVKMIVLVLFCHPVHNTNKAIFFWRMLSTAFRFNILCLGAHIHLQWRLCRLFDPDGILLAPSDSDMETWFCKHVLKIVSVHPSVCPVHFQNICISLRSVPQATHWIHWLHCLCFLSLLRLIFYLLLNVYINCLSLFACT